MYLSKLELSHKNHNTLQELWGLSPVLSVNLCPLNTAAYSLLT